MQIIYLSAAMSGIKDFNRPRMNEVADMLRGTGVFRVHNPAEYDQWPMYCMAHSLRVTDKDEAMKDPKIHDDFWRFCLTNDKATLATGRFNSLVLIPPWDKSTGVLLEMVDSAILMKMPVYEFNDKNPSVKTFSLDELDIQVNVTGSPIGKSLEF